MKQVTIVLLDKSSAKIIEATPIEILDISQIESKESEIKQTISTPETRRLRKEARSVYFSLIMEKLTNSREIVLFGPDNTKEEFLDYLKTAAKPLFDKVIGVESSKEMPEEKIIARGRKYI